MFVKRTYCDFNHMGCIRDLTDTETWCSPKLSTQRKHDVSNGNDNAVYNIAIRQGEIAKIVTDTTTIVHVQPNSTVPL